MKVIYKLGVDALLAKKRARRTKAYMEFKHLQYKYLTKNKDLSED
jgi:hypothetical protein